MYPFIYQGRVSQSVRRASPGRRDDISGEAREYSENLGRSILIPDILFFSSPIFASPSGKTHQKMYFSTQSQHFGDSEFGASIRFLSASRNRRSSRNAQEAKAARKIQISLPLERS